MQVKRREQSSRQSQFALLAISTFAPLSRLMGFYRARSGTRHIHRCATLSSHERCHRPLYDVSSNGPSHRPSPGPLQGPHAESPRPLAGPAIPIPIPIPLSTPQAPSVPASNSSSRSSLSATTPISSSPLQMNLFPMIRTPPPVVTKPETVKSMVDHPLSSDVVEISFPLPSNGTYIYAAFILVAALALRHDLWGFCEVVVLERMGVCEGAKAQAAAEVMELYSLRGWATWAWGLMVPQ